MRHISNSRIIEVRKADLIAKIKENRDKHIIDYNEAVVSYRKEAKKQLAEQKKALDRGELNIRVQLITPIDMTSEYNKRIEMFEWDIKDVVELSQGEFNEYILDELDFAINARLSNMTYKSKGL